MLAIVYLLVLLLFVREIRLHPCVLLRPSMWCSAAMLLLINGAAAFAEIEEDRYLESPELVRLLAILFPLGVLGWSWLTPASTALAQSLFERCRAADIRSWKPSGAELSYACGVGLVSILILVLYTGFVPPAQWGLRAVLAGDSQSALAREESLKLITNPIVRYTYPAHMLVLGPFLAITAFLWRPRQPLLRGLRIPLIVLIALSVMLTGARSPGGALVVGLAVAHLLRRGLYAGAAAIGLSVLFGLSLAGTLSIAREGMMGTMDLTAAVDTYGRGMTDRAFVTPFKTGVWTNLYAEEHGLLGIRNIRPLALLFDEDYCYLPNAVAKEFMPHVMDSANANTCFLFDFQASFGLAVGWVVALVLLCALDSVLICFRPLSPGMLIACLSTFLLCTFSLLSAAFSVCLISHGIAASAGLAVVFNAWHGNPRAHGHQAARRPCRRALQNSWR